MVLRENLRVLRTTLDNFYADKGRYPTTLNELVSQRYLWVIPPDPLTNSNDTWVTIPPSTGEQPEGVWNVKSGAPGLARDGRSYADF